MNSKSFAGMMKIIALFGVGIGVLLFILTQSGVEIPIVIGTTTYEGMEASLLLLIGSPIVVILIGFIISIFSFSTGKK
ncbi:hypothetical protein [Paenibacillus sp. 1011MAR3C5]|uniref:hypothetical protein n=1 Tax=Paenibacillus sp. 1011MAR3C5 TaxID=1675787 RepID=UPI00217606DA|nr:hypothetical protein [Paenibacillus sp. 1011MAR3C5]